MKRACENCEFWDGVGGFTMGVCRKSPPSFFELSTDDGICRGEWPTTNPADWCGEFKPREDGDE